tara:strand:- start:329 stop:445 length:117 start_codon:yes stop_codon:yes gene_type:complete
VSNLFIYLKDDVKKIGARKMKDKNLARTQRSIACPLKD